MLLRVLAYQPSTLCSVLAAVSDCVPVPEGDKGRQAGDNVAPA